MKTRALIGLCSFALGLACSESGSTTLDASEMLDSDAGMIADVGAVADAADRDATEADAMASPDVGSAADTGTDLDAGPDADTGASDAGPPADSGVSVDRGMYDQDGPLAVTELTLNVNTGARSFDEHVYVPAGAGPFPVVSLSPGLQQGSAAYAPYLHRLASFGIIAISHDDFGALTNTTVCTEALAYLIGTWLPAQHADNTSPLFGKIDLLHIGLGGHSRGGKASLIATEASAAVSAWFGIDPVDATTLSGGTDAIDGLPALHVPLAFLGASVSGACSPANSNYEVLYAAANSPAVKITATNAGHVQFELASECSLCGLCNPAGTADSAIVLAYSVRYLTAFFARELLADSNVGAAFEGAGAAADSADGRVSIVSK